jgi:RND family efflux transporter MFP subunit
MLVIALGSCTAEGDKKQTNIDAVPVTVGNVKKVQDLETIFASGTVSTPDSPAEVSFLVSDKVIFVGPREGDYVRKGQLLASIDPTDYQLALTTATKQAEMTRIAFERADDEHRRMKMLFDSKSLAPNDYEKYRATYESDRHQYEQAIAQEKISRKRLADAELHSPVNGFISKRSIEPGETASTGRPVFEIVQLDTVEVHVGVPETDIHLAKIGQKASITFPALPKQSFEGTVRVINVSADPGTRTYMSRISVPNPGHVIRIGMVAEAKIVGDRQISMMTVPGEAIVRDDQGATMVFVYFPEQRCVYSKRVKTGTFRGTEVEIKEGLSGNESIVIAGQDHLRDGMPVTIAILPSEDSSDKRGRSR